MGWIGMKSGTNIHGPQREKPADFKDPLTLPCGTSVWSAFSLHSEMSLTTIGWTAMIFGVDIHGTQRMNLW